VALVVQAGLLHFQWRIVSHRPIQREEKAMELSQLAALIILVADIYAIVMVLQSSARSIEKLLWVLVILLLPLIGLVIWFFAGPGKKPF
jgi:hypothetical protein